MDIKTVKHIAKLSNLELSDEELKLFTKELSAIVDHVSELNELDTKDMEETAHAIALQNVFRNDENAKKANPELAAELVNAASDKEDGYVKVKAILGDK